MNCQKPDHLQAYQAAVREHGPGFAATLWKSREAQHLRFEVMIRLADFNGSVIVDAGCGAGDFAAHLLERGVNFRQYVGIDALAEMIQCAGNRGLERCRFVHADLLADALPMIEAQPDFVCLSGTLNTMDEASARRLVKLAFDTAARGVVFNFLSDRPHPRWEQQATHPARRFDTLGWLEWSLSLSSRVSFTQDYLDGHDATILIRRDASGPAAP
jgi:SAM-dependent methyltransferase